MHYIGAGSGAASSAIGGDSSSTAGVSAEASRFTTGSGANSSATCCSGTAQAGLRDLSLVDRTKRMLEIPPVARSQLQIDPPPPRQTNPPIFETRWPHAQRALRRA